MIAAKIAWLIGAGATLSTVFTGVYNGLFGGGVITLAISTGILLYAKFDNWSNDNDQSA